MSGRKENNVIHCFSNEGSPSRNVCSFFILHNIEKAFLEKSNLWQDVSQNILRISVFSFNNTFSRFFILNQKLQKVFLRTHLFPKIYSIGGDWVVPDIQIIWHDAEKTNSALFRWKRNLSLRIALPIHSNTKNTNTNTNKK